MPKQKHILFLVPDGVGIKNYLYSDLIKHIKEDAIVTIWSTLPLEAFDDVKGIHDIDFNYKQIQLSPENSLTRLYREATTYARLIHNSKLKENPTILTNWRRPNYSFKVKVLYKFAEILGKFLSKNYSRILNFEKKSIEKISQGAIKNYKKELQELKPTTIFITHQRVAGLMPICLAAKQNNIKTVTAIFSWDNLPKARLAVKTDDYYVWSKWMKQEMKDYYPEIPEDNVILVGTPQFEFYLDQNRFITREDFAKTHGLDTKKKWLCFSGDDIATSPYDQLFLEDVAESLNSKKDDLQIIFRRCPVDFSSRYDEVLNRFNDLIVPIDPIWNVQSETGWVGYFPKFNDISMQVNLSYHCSLVINLGSTMALDFATFNKPCLYLNYNPSNDNNWSTKIIYNFQHFRSMNGLNAVGWINDKASILEVVNNALNHPETIAPERKKWMEILVQHPIDQNARLIAKSLF
ncbi:hypothetical protein [uncultured Winogradskyella sp.]|uniref:MGDG synthase family glycosyltransferase n=1 Tax=uncultured Winogradskyella sp. TaxID=395353 RepID=UPI00262B6F46|nr:hypothetical protein [uncultured Winogradskyella sp.]